MTTRRGFLHAAAAGVAAASSSTPLLIGVGSSAHQVEGGNVNNDFWFTEHAAPTMFREPSGDACDHYNRFEADIQLLAKLGFKGYRFSVEWSRVEPERGEFALAQLQHYRRMAEACRENGIAPLITLHHFTSPFWLARNGGWEKAEAAELFARYSQRVAKAMGTLPLGYCTINEINVPPFVKRSAGRIPGLAQLRQMLAAKSQSGEFSTLFFGDADKIVANMAEGHRKTMAALRSENGSVLAGLTLAMRDHQAVPGGEENLRAIQKTDYEPFFELAAGDGFVGVQSYSRIRVGAAGELPVDAGAEKTESGSEYYPQALENSIRYVASKCKVPVIVTENGIPTKNDEQRIRYMREALAGVKRCVNDKLDVRGYFHWSAFDSFEFIYGYHHPYGLIAVDRQSFARTPKPSAKFLGSYRFA